MGNLVERRLKLAAHERVARKRVARLLLVGSGFIAPSLAVAQEVAESSHGTADIVVTATKRSENLMDIPVAVSAYSGETLSKLGVTGPQALQIATPAVTFPNTGAYSQPYIRGVGSRLLQNGFDPSVATYVDGRYISRQSAINFEFTDIERVEVLKGPQGVLFGRNASAGANMDYRHEMANGGGAFIGATYNWQSSSEGAIGGARTGVPTYPDMAALGLTSRVLPGLTTPYLLKAYQTLDLRAGYEAPDEAWKVMVWGKNVLNEFYWTGVNPSTDSTSRLTGRPATYGITFGFKFK